MSSYYAPACGPPAAPRSQSLHDEARTWTNRFASGASEHVGVQADPEVRPTRQPASSSSQQRPQQPVLQSTAEQLAYSENYWAGWRREIAKNDPRGWAQAGDDVHTYLHTKCQWLVNEVLTKKAGMNTWAWRDPQGPKRRCTVFCDGRSESSQCTVLGTPTGNVDCHWPALVIDVPGDILPFVCPALMWMNARPWRVHRSRLNFLDPEPVGAPPPPPPRRCPPPPPPPPQADSCYVLTPGPLIEEVEESDVGSDLCVEAPDVPPPPAQVAPGPALAPAPAGEEVCDSDAEWIHAVDLR